MIFTFPSVLYFKMIKRLLISPRLNEKGFKLCQYSTPPAQSPKNQAGGADPLISINTWAYLYRYLAGLLSCYVLEHPLQRGWKKRTAFHAMCADLMV